MSDPSLDDLICLNQEIAAFVKAGVPMELGLRGLTGSVSSRLGRLAQRLADRLTNGQKLSDALAEEGPVVSPVYTAVIEAGIASGKLPEALESLTASSLMIQELRRRLMLAAIYPMMCAVFAYGLFCLFIAGMAPHLIDTVGSFSAGWPVRFLQFLNRNSDYFIQVIPSVVLTFVVVVVLLRKTFMRRVWERMTSLRWVTGRSLNWAQFTEILALQLEHGAPLAPSFTLAANATEDRRLRREALLVSSELGDGQSLTRSLQSVRSLPPLVRWMLASAEKQGTLAATLRQLSAMYRRQALRRAAIIKVWFPVAMTVFFTTVIGLSYALAFFLPLRAFLIGLMQE
jgi:general secretion pathway protein F